VRTLIAAGVVLAGLVALFAWAFSPRVEPLDLGAGRAEGPSSPRDGRPRADTAVPPVAERADDAEEPAPSADGDADAVEPPPTDAPNRAVPESPLTGLEVRSVSRAALERQNAPDAFDGGVLVTDIAPDSPADEVALQAGDIIVEARMKPVRSPSDLESIVGVRTYARVTFIREGQVFQVLLQRPFPPHPEN